MDFLTIKKKTEYELTEKRSRFIAYAFPVSTEEEALKEIEGIKSIHKTAKHNIYAYKLREQNKMRYSDDKEPQGTAGLPVLDIIQKEGLTDTLVVVTRYFGGILLGTGGLMRAYSEAAKQALLKSGIIKKVLCDIIEIITDYNYYDKILNLLISEGKITDTRFENNIIITAYCDKDKTENVMKKLNDITNGKIRTEIKKQAFIEI